MLKYRLVQENFKQLEVAKEVLEKTEKTETSQQNTPTPAVSASGAEQLAMIIRQMEMNMSQNYDFSTEKTVEENTGTNSTRAPEETAKATDEDMAEIVDFLNNGRLTKATEKLNNLGISYQLDKPSQTMYTMNSIEEVTQQIKPPTFKLEISQDECEDFANNTLVWNIRKNNQDLTEKKTLNSENSKNNLLMTLFKNTALSLLMQITY